MPSFENNFFKGKKVLVAGGTGLIGIPLVKILFDKGACIRIASLDDVSRVHPKAEFHQVDLTDFNNCVTVCRNMDVVFNLLCTKGSPAVAQRKPASFFVPMLRYNTNLMEAARRQKVDSYLFASSVAVYSPAEIFYEEDVWKTFPSENDRFGGWAKRMGELQAQAYAIEYGWNKIAIVRPSNVYGPSDNFDPINAMVVPSLIKRVAETEDKIVVWGDGSAERDFIYADDVAQGMILAVEKQLNPDQPVNLGSGVGVSIRKLVETIVNVSGKELQIVWDASKPSGDRKRIMDIQKAKSIGFFPKISLEEGVRKTYHWYLANKESARDRYDIFNQDQTV